MSFLKWKQYQNSRRNKKAWNVFLCLNCNCVVSAIPLGQVGTGVVVNPVVVNPGAFSVLSVCEFCQSQCKAQDNFHDIGVDNVTFEFLRNLEES